MYNVYNNTITTLFRKCLPLQERYINPVEGTRAIFAGDDLVTTALGYNNDITPVAKGRLALAYNRINLFRFPIYYIK